MTRFSCIGKRRVQLPLSAWISNNIIQKKLNYLEMPLKNAKMTFTDIKR